MQTGAYPYPDAYALLRSRAARSKDELEAARRMGVERPPSLPRKFVEALLYLSIFYSNILLPLGFPSIPWAGGGLAVISGSVCLAIWLGSRERLMLSIWAVLIVNIMANLSQGLAHGQMPIFGEGLRHLLFWLCQLAMLCFLVQNRATERRVILVVSLLIIVPVAMIGGAVENTAHQRLEVEQFSFVGNANGLAYLSAMFAVALLFWSLRSSKALRPVLWFLAAVLIVICLRTVSRGGILALSVGLAMFLITILLGRGVRLSGAILLVVGLVAMSQLGFLLAGAIEHLEQRVGEESVRMKIFSYHTLEDLWETKIFGVGGAHAGLTAMGGVNAHNTFVHTHRVYGGITAWPLIIWIMILGFRVGKLIVAGDFPFDTRMRVAAAFAIALACYSFTNAGFVSLAVLYATALVEKYTSCYSRRQQRARESYGLSAAMVPYPPSTWARPTY